MKIIDISWPITEDMTAYKNRHTVSLEQTKNFKQDKVRESKITLGSHSGTHVDAPAHFLRDGAYYDQLPLSLFIGPCTVIDMTQVESRILWEDIEQEKIKKDHIILLKTRNSYLKPQASFNYEFVYIAKTGAQYLVDRSVKAVGIDYLGIEREQPEHDTHMLFMQNGIGIIEGLRLEHVVPGEYQLFCLPLACIGTEAAPARAILVQT